MGLLPPRKKSNLLFKSRSSTSKCPQEDPLNSTPLPLEAQKLKIQILKTHPNSLMRFSMSRMRHIVPRPPVEIPADLRQKNAVSIRVSGHCVPLTRSMWDKKMMRYKKSKLDIIGEGIYYG
ncbi:hypothetical protein PHMEG_00023799 [Phytophthora megakarya]|uniref:Uncharacterized protein n=1 Tax=Phytophthora megakarya TaxID=4795 RepID=A0A225VHQ4_9STRA|nr:hypothetical protein PHMEG_00023799 [Phytophthora megakarya]